MTEYEKMISGLPYDPSDGDLAARRRQAGSLCRRLNLLDLHEKQARQRLLQALLGGMKEHAAVMPGFWCDYGCNITVGAEFYANYNCVILDCAPVTFGDYVLIGPNCGFYTAAHPLASGVRKTGIEYAKPIAVGDNVWFGGNVTVLAGVTIGSGSILGAGSVVIHDIPPNVIAVGSPCRPIRPAPDNSHAF